MKKVLATLIVLASVNSMAASFKVCQLNDMTLECVPGTVRTITNNRELGVPSNAAPEQVGGDINPAYPKSWSPGTHGMLYKALEAYAKAIGSTGPASEDCGNGELSPCK
jgi:hypothetical protein